MGAQLVGKAFAFGMAHSLTGNEFRLLAFMAHTALDTDQPPRYYGSRERSAFGLGIAVPEHDDTPEAAKARRSAFEVVRRATAALVDAGAITRVRSGRAGQRAEFTILTGFTLDDLASSPNESLGLRSSSPNETLGRQSNQTLPHQAQQVVAGRPNDPSAPRNHLRNHLRN